MRLLGFTVGDDVVLKGEAFSTKLALLVPDLVEIGHGSSLNMCGITNVRYDARNINFYKITIGERVVVRPGAQLVGRVTIGDDATLDYCSGLTNNSIPKQEFWSGAIAKKEAVRLPTSESQEADTYELSKVNSYTVSLIHYVINYLQRFIRLAPGIIIWYALPSLRFVSRWTIVKTINTLFFPISDLVLGICLSRIVSICDWTDRKCHWKSIIAVRMDLLAWAYALNAWNLTNTVFFTPYTRICGASIGKHTEVTVPGEVGCIAELLHFGSNVFLANYAFIGFPAFERGWSCAKITRVGDNSLIGNRAVLPPGTRLNAGSIIGVSSVPPRDCYERTPQPPESPGNGRNDDHCEGGADAGVHCIGCPPVYLHKDDLHNDDPVQPSVLSYSRRILFDMIQVFYVSAFYQVYAFCVILSIFLFHRFATLAHNPVGISGHSWLDVANQLRQLYDPSKIAVLATIAVGIRYALGSLSGFLALVFRGGRIKEGSYPYWNQFVDLWHLHYKAKHVMDKYVTSDFGLTELNVIILRSLGFNWFTPWDLSANYVAKRTTREVDVTHIRGGAIVEPDATLRTHTFEGWNLSIGAVEIGAGSRIGAGAHIMPGAIIEPGCDILPNSIVMKNETVPAGCIYGGAPGAVLGYHS